MDEIRLKGIVIDRKILEQRYSIVLTDLEWKIFNNYISNSWNSKEFELDRVINKHVINSLQKMGFNSVLEGMNVVMKKK